MIRTVRELLDSRLKVCVGDITEFDGDAVVNAANSSLLGGGGVDGAIHRAGGPAIASECREIRRASFPDGLPAGEAVVTGAGNLPCGRVIHTVGPVWRGGNGGEEALLESAYRRSLECARDNSLAAVAFPAVSTGIYGFPKGPAARIAYRTISAFLAAGTMPREVFLVFFSQADADIFLREL